MTPKDNPAFYLLPRPLSKITVCINTVYAYSIISISKCKTLFEIQQDSPDKDQNEKYFRSVTNTVSICHLHAAALSGKRCAALPLTEGCRRVKVNSPHTHCYRILWSAAHTPAAGAAAQKYPAYKAFSVSVLSYSLSTG